MFSTSSSQRPFKSSSGIWSRSRAKKPKKEKPKLLCPQCGSEVDPSDEFCLECGKLLLLDEDYDAYADAQDLEEDN